MSKAVKSVTSVFSGPSSSAYNAAGGIALDRTPFEIEKEIKPTQDAYKSQLASALVQQEQAKNAGLGVMSVLGQQARGEGPSLATAQLKAAQERGLAQQMAALSSARGGSGAANQRALAQNMSSGNRAMAQDSAQARIAEMGQAQDRYFNQANLAEERARADILQAGDLDLAQKKAFQQFELARANQAAGINQADLAAKSQFRSALAGGGAQAGSAALMMMSDKNVKKDIKPADKKIQSFLDALSSREYKYKDESNGEGKRFGIMAQDLEKSEIGKALVKPTSEGKGVDMAQGFGAILASQAELNKRLKMLEKKKKA